MTSIYIVRHCEALGNAARLFQGHTDLDISETGIKQLEFLEKRFESIQLDRVYSSPLIRTQKTAAAIKSNKPLKVEIHKGLIEINGGFLEGKPFKDTFGTMPELADIWLNHPHKFHPEGGEAMASAYERIWETVLSIAKENKGKTVACATHGGVTRCLNCRLMFRDIKKLKDVPWSDNTAIALIEFDDSFNPKLKFLNDTSHLPEEFNPKNNRISNIKFGENK